MVLFTQQINSKFIVRSLLVLGLTQNRFYKQICVIEFFWRRNVYGHT